MCYNLHTWHVIMPADQMLQVSWVSCAQHAPICFHALLGPEVGAATLLSSAFVCLTKHRLRQQHTMSVCTHKRSSLLGCCMQVPGLGCLQSLSGRSDQLDCGATHHLHIGNHPEQRRCKLTTFTFCGVIVVHITVCIAYPHVYIPCSLATTPHHQAI